MSWEAYIEQSTDSWPIKAREFTHNLADWFASDPFGDWPPGYRSEHIFRAVCRKKEVVEARHIIMYLMKQKSALTLQTIGRLMHRHHATVIYAVAKLEECHKFDPLLAKKLRAAQAKTSTWDVAF